MKKERKKKKNGSTIIMVQNIAFQELQKSEIIERR